MGSGENLLLKPMVYSVPEVDRGGIVRKGVSFPSLWDLGEVSQLGFAARCYIGNARRSKPGLREWGDLFFSQ